MALTQFHRLLSGLKPLVLRELEQRAGARPSDAYQLRKALAAFSPMDIGAALDALEAEGRARSADPSGTANDLARCFSFVRWAPQAWDAGPERSPFKFEGDWWFVGQASAGPYDSLAAARAARRAELQPLAA